MQARRGELVDALGCPGLVAERAGSRVGILTYRLGDQDAEIVFVEATTKHSGIGTALVDAFVAMAAGLRVWLVTTNDNLDALRFYRAVGRWGLRVSPNMSVTYSIFWSTLRGQQTNTRRSQRLSTGRTDSWTTSNGECTNGCTNRARRRPRSTGNRALPLAPAADLGPSRYWARSSAGESRTWWELLRGPECRRAGVRDGVTGRGRDVGGEEQRGDQADDSDHGQCDHGEGVRAIW